MGLSETLSYALLVYLCVCIFVFVRSTHGNIIFDILEQSYFQKCAICRVFPALSNLCICVIVYETLGNISFDILGPRAFRKMYGVYGLKHHTVDISGDVTDAGRRQRTTTSEDRATQLFICETLSLAILHFRLWRSS